MSETRPRFGFAKREDDRYCRFWFRGKLCDAYLGNWTTTRLFHNIARQHSGFGLKAWRNWAEDGGKIEWDMNDLGITDFNEDPRGIPHAMEMVGNLGLERIFFSCQLEVKLSI
jgi:hypothetical protein